jgi:thioesterase domain-containing protein
VLSERELETYLHAKIPLSGAMGVRVMKATRDEIRLLVPLQPNLNHRNTIFGGSASAAAILAGWALIFMRLDGWDPRPELVIQANHMQYLKPISCDFEVATEPLKEDAWACFVRSLERKGRGRIQAHSTLTFEGETCGEFSGTFVALRDHS